MWVLILERVYDYKVMSINSGREVITKNSLPYSTLLSSLLFPALCHPLPQVLLDLNHHGESLAV